MLEIDSNLVENYIRPSSWKKKLFFCRISRFRPKLAMFYSFFGTCKKLDIDPQKWLKYVMENIKYYTFRNFKELLPQYIDKSLLQ